MADKKMIDHIPPSMYRDLLAELKEHFGEKATSEANTELSKKELELNADISGWAKKENS